MLQELLRIFGAITKFNADDTVWIKVLQRKPTLLNCTVDQIRNTVSFLEMLDMSPAQVMFLGIIAQSLVIRPMAPCRVLSNYATTRIH